jgi:hypothetical protein
MTQYAPQPLSNETGSQQRINERLKTYWGELRGNRPYPCEKEIDFNAIEPIWKSCFLVKRDETKQARFSYIYLGSDLIAAYGDDLSTREICERLVFPSSMPLMHKFDEVVNTQAPVEQEDEFTNTKGLHVKYRSLMLPLGNDEGTDVEFIIGGMRWKAYL